MTITTTPNLSLDLLLTLSIMFKIYFHQHRAEWLVCGGETQSTKVHISSTRFQINSYVDLRCENFQ